MANFFLNRGGAGISIRREETVQRLNPLIERLIALNHCHNYIIQHTSDPATAERLEAFQKIARADVGKLAETVLSSGGVPYNGTDMEPSDFNLGTDEDSMLREMTDRERAFLDAIEDEKDVRHHIRTQAILEKVRANSKARADFLEDAIKRIGRPVGAG